jgi:hypothetical protein
MKLKSIALAAALVASSACSFAATSISLAAGPVPNSFAGSFSGSAAVNTFTLDLTGYSNITDLGSVISANVVGTGYDITGATFDGIAYTVVQDVNALPYFSFDIRTYFPGPVSSTIHTITITGNSTGGQGFTGNVGILTAVPEPESYAMLLAGLGLMGGIARRRNNKAA